jgi:diguanylate cyclase (GGDEF)-like protein/PAS domain S-box-containing protein
MHDPESGITVLAVVASTADADRLEHLLRQASETGHQVIRSGSLQEALGRLDRGGLDVVLLQLSLPDSNGLATYQRARDRAAGTPIVVLADAWTGDHATLALAEGAHGALVLADLTAELLDYAVRMAVERQRAEQRLREHEERLDLAFEGANVGLWDWDLGLASVYYSARWNGLLGLPERPVVADPKHWFDRVHPEDLRGVQGMVQVHLDGGSRRFECEHRIQDAAGDHLWVVVRGQSIRDLEGTPRRLVGTMSDITARKQIEGQLLHRALHDELTGLANRALFLDRVSLYLARLSRETSAHFAVMFLDLDNFKRVNDSLGHTVGDRLLTEVAQRLASVIRPGDTAARLGGDEFGVLLGNVAEGSVAVQVTARIQSLLEESFIIDGREIWISSSAGIALSSSSYAEADELLHDADVAMYRAKATGRGQCEVFDPDVHRSAVTLRELEAQMRRGIGSEAFVMHYQPVVSVESGAIAGFEGLVRWQHPDRGLLAPSEFLAVAERSSLIIPIGWWALAETCRQACLWQQRFGRDRPLWVGINISGKLFRQVDMVERLLSVLAKTGLEPGRLRLELAEHLIVDHGDAALTRLRELREVGVRLTIDDFGLGYASLNYLQLFQYDSLKIRPSYINHLENISPTLVKTILMLAGDLGIEVVAEGVETAE